VEALGAVQALIDERGHAPTVQEVADRLSLRSKSRAHRLLAALEERGHVAKGANVARSIALLRGR
jgi:SOS-response transcriptional repressor LexA